MRTFKKKKKDPFIHKSVIIWGKENLILERNAQIYEHVIIRARENQVKIGESGYLYILSTKAKTKGNYILHPTKENKNIFKDELQGSSNFISPNSKNKTVSKSDFISDFSSSFKSDRINSIGSGLS